MQKREKGITLVALVITIIILLILAGISISALTNQGLFGQAKNAKNLTEEKAAEENATLENYLEQINEITGEKQTLANKVQPGDYVTYTPDKVTTSDSAYTELNAELTTYSGNTDSTKNTETTISTEKDKDLKWRVLDVENGKVRLISEVPTTSTVALEGYNGYNNAVYLLDKTCKTLYSKAGYTENVQNLKVEDIVKYMNTKPTDDSTTYSPTGKLMYPSILMQEKDQTITASDGTTQPAIRLDVSEQTTPISQTAINTAASWRLKNTYWAKQLNFDPIYENLFIRDKDYNDYADYWISSRCVVAYPSLATFCVRYVSHCRGEANNLWSSYGDINSPTFALRPVITLKSNVLVKTGDGTSGTPYEIGL